MEAVFKPCSTFRAQTTVRTDGAIRRWMTMEGLTAKEVNGLRTNTI